MVSLCSRYEMVAVRNSRQEIVSASGVDGRRIATKTDRMKGVLTHNLAMIDELF